MMAAWMDEAARQAEEIFTRNEVRLTLGGEPTYIPVKPTGPEWSYTAVGPTKLEYARRLADELMEGRMKGAARFFCPGKLYPGETNPRWVVRLLANRDGTPLFQLPKRAKALTSGSVQQLADAISKYLGVPSQWIGLSDPNDEGSEILAMPLDYDGARWISARWPLAKGERKLSAAEGPAGLRLPLHLLPAGLPKRAISIERKNKVMVVFLPPVLQKPFLELVGATENALRRLSLNQVELHGYTPSDEAGRWTVLGLAADPGVLEVNLPPCKSWREYADWMETLAGCAEKAGLRSWKEVPGDHPQGSGGGNHLLWGGENFDTHPFFTRPAWLAGVLRYWQHHPSLAYLFTGCYVGASSQAPRPDESARDLYDIDMAYTFLETLPPGDHRELINETLRHIHTDVTGNSHRSEISFDKFWNTSFPSGALGLIEFRAIEAVPKAEWAAAVALLWSCIAAHLLEGERPKGLKRYGHRLLDEYFLPTPLWDDLAEVLHDLRKSGLVLDEAIYREIWEWRYPAVLEWKKNGASLTVRKAMESWPLLCETPVEGGSTSRFVDTSMQRLEFAAEGGFEEKYRIYVAGKPLGLKKAGDTLLAGLRYRRTNLYPSLHPGIPPQVPLVITVIDRESGRIAGEYSMGGDDIIFHTGGRRTAKLGERPCRGGRKSDLTADLRLE